MKASFHYVVKAKLIRLIKENEIDFLDVEEKFENENPIIAREKAFNHYQNLIDVLLQGKNKKYFSDKQARAELTSFIDPGTKTKVQIGDKEIEFSDSLGNGIGVFIVIDKPMIDKIIDDKIGDEYLIHGIGRMSCSDDPQSLMDGLNHEYWYYEHFAYDTKNYLQTIDFYEYDIAETEPNEILETPFDWTGYDKPDEEETSEVVEEIKPAPATVKSYEEFIEGGESNQVEFKTNLLYYHDKEGEKSGYRKFVRHIIAKVISSFLNSNGGLLFVGVSDKKEMQGLKDDFSLARPIGKDPKDYFTLEIDKIIREYFKGVASNIKGEFTVIKGVEIYVFLVSPNKNRPIFISGQNGKEFYVRLTTSCEPYTDIEQIANYCIEKWGT